VGTSRVRNQESLSSFKAISSFYGDGVKLAESEDNLSLYNYGYCADSVNPMSLMGSGFDIGGPLFSLQASHDFQPIAVEARGGIFNAEWRLNGPIMAAPLYAFMSPQAENSRYVGDQLDSLGFRIGLGATAISRSRPAKPQASLTTTVAEALREGVPNTLKQFVNMKDEVARFRDIQRSTNFKRAVSRSIDGHKRTAVPSKYLEYEFGWKPLVSDIRKASRALLKYEEIFEDLHRNSGRRMRRRYSFPAESTVEEVVRDNAFPWPAPNLYLLQQTGNRVVTKHQTKRTWFAGEFIYSFPTADVALPRKVFSGARQLLGLDLTPETIWNTAPWTWLADWFTNIGDVTANFTAIGADGLILRYGYLMQEVERRWVHEHFGVSIPSAGVNNARVMGQSVFTAKTRISASPFGFGTTFDSLSPRQVAILTSIGLTR